MLPTPRLLGLFLLVVPLLIGAAFVPVLIWIALIYLLVVIGILISDLRITPRPSALEVERVHDQRLSIGAPNVITLILANTSTHPLTFTLRDEFPDTIPSDAQFLSGTLPAYDVHEARYHCVRSSAATTSSVMWCCAIAAC